MTITKKDFVRIAKIVNKRHSVMIDTACGYGMELIIDDLADYFKEVNPKFKKELFMEKCFNVGGEE